MQHVHRCPGGCGKAVADHRYACGACWFRLPDAVRDRITETYGRSPDAHARALHAARRWFVENPHGRPVTP
jgi:hypothetical protein